MPILDQMVLEQNTEGTRWTPSKMIHRLGKEVNSPDFVKYVYYNDIPVFCPALPHASLGDVIYVRSYKNPARVLDISECERQKRESGQGVVYGDASIIFPLLVAETFPSRTSQLRGEERLTAPHLLHISSSSSQILF
uniref:Deoxyhypusine synthase n=1 Tax=Scleropages formosus TaxID=113540 RepID=A0A8C9WSU1_SCLFO